ncbi:MAG: T9SS type A sorting domain-containing protein [Bacteroidales bacterium]|nr:T9SS type A sorting domain-containing protein [Bacteroidales bacterium]
MKKKKQLTVLFCAIAFCLGSAQPYNALVLESNSYPNPYEHQILDSLVAKIDGLVIDSILDQDAFRDGPEWATAAGYDGYDLFIIMETVSSSRTENFGTAGFPIPCLCLEPYAPQRPTWFNVDNYNIASQYTDSCQSFVVRSPAHEIFTGIANEGEEVIWTNSVNDGSVDFVKVHCAFLETLAGGPFDDVAQNATNTAYAKQMYDSGYTNNAWLWAIEGEAGATLENRMVVIADHYDYYQYATQAFYDVLVNSTKWILGLPIIVEPTPPNLKLSDLLVDGVTITGFNPDVKTYNYILPYGETVVPTVTCTTQDTAATYYIDPAPVVNDTTFITVFSSDSSSTNQYFIVFPTAPISTNATLDDLKINNQTVSGFNSYVFAYSVTLPYGTTEVPDVSFTLTNINSTTIIDTAKTLSDTTFIYVTSEDMTNFSTYQVSFNIANPSSDATLIDLLVDGSTIPGFDRHTLNYIYNMFSDVTAIPNVTAIKNHAGATVNIIQADSPYDTAFVEVIAQNGTTQNIYVIDFVESAGIESLTTGKIHLYPSPVKDFLKITISAEHIDMHASIYSITGEKVIVQEIKKNATLIDCSALHSGMYFVTITKNDHKYSGKIIKQ